MRNLSLGEAFAYDSPMGDRNVWRAAVERECPPGSVRGCVQWLETEARRICGERIARSTRSWRTPRGPG
jgi:hypothetical protein